MINQTKIISKNTGLNNLRHAEALKNGNIELARKIAKEMGIEPIEEEKKELSGKTWEAKCTSCGMPKFIPIEKEGFYCDRCDQDITEELYDHECHLHNIGYYRNF